MSATSRLEAKRRREVRIRNKVTRQEPLTSGEAAVLVAALDLSRGMERAQMSAILYEIGGTVEGRPTQSINYLQRLRQLVASEKKLEALEREVRWAEHYATLARLGETE